MSPSLLKSIRAARRKTTNPQISRPRKLQAAVKKLTIMVDAVDDGAPKDKGLYLAYIREQFATDPSLSTLTKRDLRQIPSVIWHGEKPHLADQVDFQEFYLEQLTERGSNVAVRNLYQAYLHSFEGNSETHLMIARVLNEMELESCPPIVRHAIEENLLKSPATAPDHIAGMVNGNNVVQILGKFHLTGGLSTSNFVEEVFVSLCKRVEIDENDRESLIKAVTRWNNVAGKDLFPKRRSNFANALLLPWKIDAPGKNLRRLITDRLVESIGDPRFSQTAWKLVDPEAKSILMRWLTRVSVLQFLDIVGQDAEDHMWSYRRSFWLSYLDEGHIEEAWVVFGSMGAARARDAAIASQDSSFRDFATFSKGVHDQAQSVLLLKIGGLTVAEWSHNGSCRIWTKSERGAPALYKKSYNATKLRAASWRKPHGGSESFKWQYAIAEKIRRNTGISMSNSRWAPK